MRTIIALFAVILVCGCQRQAAKHLSTPALSVEPSATGTWECDLGKGPVRLLINESNGLIRGAVEVPWMKEFHPHVVRGFHTGKTIELYYDVAHAFPVSNFTNINSYSFKGMLEGDSLNGMLIFSAGTGRGISDWKAKRIDVADQVLPAIDESPIVEKEEPYKEDTNLVAFQKSMKELRRDFDEYQRESSNMPPTRATK